MANLHDCLQVALEAGEVDRTRARAAQEEFNQLVARYSTTMPRHQAEAKAAADLKEAIRRSASSRRYAVLTQLQSMTRIEHLVKGAQDPAVAVRNFIEASPGSGFRGESVNSIYRGLVKSVNAGLNDFLKATGRKPWGSSRNKALLTDVIRILHGDDVTNPVARALADAIKTQQERMRRMFNAYGGDIGKLEDFGVSHSHDAQRMRRMGFDAWRAEIAPRLDWSRITDLSTGAAFAAKKGDMPAGDIADRFLKDIYDGILSGGWTRREPSMAMGGKALYNRRAEPRLLHFKSGQDWLDYNSAFGTSDPFSAVVGGLHGIARDIAMMRVLGPNPRMGLEYANQVAHKLAAMDPDLAVRVRKQGALAKTMLAHYDGSVNQTEAAGWAAFFSNTRKTLSSIQLGSAALSAVTDLATISAASVTVGMNPANVLSRSARLMASQATRRTAARMGYVADTLAEAGAAAARFTGDVIGGELAERVSGFTMRASGLSFWTDMNRLAYQMEFAGFMADNADLAFDAIDASLRRTLSERGITAADWDHLRAPDARFRDGNSGADFISPFYWLEHQTTMSRAEAEGLAMRVQGVIEEHLERAVPTASLEGRARLIGNTAPGTVSGELARSMGTYKSFAMSLMLNQIRVWNDLPTPLAKWTYAASMGAGLTVLGALAIQLKEISKGRDPRPMTDTKFWGAAVMQGGGLGIFGDFFASETSRAGGGVAETVAGPVAGLASDLLGPLASNAARLAQGKDTTLGRDVANLVRYNTPVASSLWYARLPYDRLVADNLQRWLDPDAEAQFNRLERRRAKDYGSPSYWPAGRTAPTRAPDPSNAMKVSP